MEDIIPVVAPWPAARWMQICLRRMEPAQFRLLSQILSLVIAYLF